MHNWSLIFLENIVFLKIIGTNPDNKPTLIAPTVIIGFGAIPLQRQLNKSDAVPTAAPQNGPRQNPEIITGKFSKVILKNVSNVNKYLHIIPMTTLGG